MDTASAYLERHDFTGLFIEGLGWDHADGSIKFQSDEQTFRFNVIAHKRSFKVVRCETDHYTLFNRARLRRLQRKLLNYIHEHIIIYSCEEPSKKQVWQWAIRRSDGRRLRHREHPFFSLSPPIDFVKRLDSLRFSFADEDRVTLVDALSRVREALDVRPAVDLFVRRPRYAEESDRLARTMQEGGIPAFHEFVLFHRSLARWGARRLFRAFKIDVEDAEQIGIIPLLRSARAFRPELGFQFSTYATHAIRRECQRVGPEAALLIRMPASTYWPCLRARRAADRLVARSGGNRARRYLERFAKRTPGWEGFCAATSVHSLSDRSQSAYHEAVQIASRHAGPEDKLAIAELSRLIADALAAIPADDADIIKRRYGLDGPIETLEEVGRSLNVTKERVRQRQLEIERALRRIVLDKLGEPPPKSKEESESGTDPERLILRHAQRALLHEVERFPGGINAVAVAARCTFPRRERRAALRLLIKQGRIVQDGAGRTAVYRPAPPDTTGTTTISRQLELYTDAT